MPALIPLAIQLFPLLASWLGIGAKGDAIASAAAQVVAAVTGTSDPHAAQAAIDADPSMKTQIVAQLAQIHADETIKARQADVEEIKAYLADVVSARQQTVALAASGSSIAWGAPVISVLILAAFAYAQWAVFNATAADTTQAQLGMIELTKVVTIAAVTYWLGSSSGSKNKDEQIATQSNQLAMSVPTAALSPKGTTADDLNARELARHR